MASLETEFLSSLSHFKRIRHLSECLAIARRDVIQIPLAQVSQSLLQLLVSSWMLAGASK